ncbi:MAG: hypothetical protein HY508_05445 [Acidobacteria bacterium]|nr:hypothetical protein [Acidobacteriota bacterium]
MGDTVVHNLDYDIDRWGNARCVADGQTQGPCANWSFNTSTNRISTSGVTYDAAGNMITSDTGVTFQYDAEGRMVSTNSGSYGTEINNALGQRVDHTWPGNRLVWLYHPDGTEMADYWQVPYNVWGNVYFNLGGRPVAKYMGGRLGSFTPTRWARPA